MKLRTHIALALLLAAVAVPVAYSGTDRPTRIGTSDVMSRYLSNRAQPTATDAEDVVARYRTNQAQPAVTGAEDVVARYLSNQAQPTATDAEDVVARYRTNQALPTVTGAEDVVARYVSSRTQTLAGPQPSARGAGFDWADAGIGAAGMLGITLLVGAATLVMRQSRRRLTSA